MKRVLLYVAGVLMTAGGLILGCAHDRCGGGGCPTGPTYGSGPAIPSPPPGSGSTGTVPQYAPPGGNTPSYTTPAPGSGSTGGFGGSGSR